MSNQIDKLSLVAEAMHQRTRVLLVDANPFITRTFEFVLKTLPEFIVVGTLNHKLAVLEMAKVQQPDIILLDTNLHKSVQLIEQLHLALPDARIIALTGMYTTPDCLLKAIEAGAETSLSKVGTLHDFLQRLQAIENRVL